MCQLFMQWHTLTYNKRGGQTFGSLCSTKIRNTFTHKSVPTLLDAIAPLKPVIFFQSHICFVRICKNSPFKKTTTEQITAVMLLFASATLSQTHSTKYKCCVDVKCSEAFELLAPNMCQDPFKGGLNRLYSAYIQASIQWYVDMLPYITQY